MDIDIRKGSDDGGFSFACAIRLTPQGTFSFPRLSNFTPPLPTKGALSAEGNFIQLQTTS